MIHLFLKEKLLLLLLWYYYYYDIIITILKVYLSCKSL